MSHPHDKEKTYWLDQPANVNKLVYALYAACAGLLIAELFVHKHGHFDFELWFGFFGFYGFCAYVFIVMSAKGMRVFLRRDENYYNDGEGDDVIPEPNHNHGRRPHD